MLILTEQCHVFNRMHNKHKIMILSLLKNYSEIGKWNVCVPLKIQYSPNVVQSDIWIQQNYYNTFKNNYQDSEGNDGDL